KHLFSDVMSSVGVVLGLFVASVTNVLILDPLIAMVVAILLIKMGISVFRTTTHDLMDSACEEEEQVIERILNDTGGFLEYHDLKTRRSGDTVYLDIHICMSGQVTLSQAHAFSVRLEKDIEAAIPGIVSNIHIEDEQWCKKAQVERPKSDRSDR
ncbi:MAG TPA: cation diffusion facilitator family transporter, partial [Methanomassiliicoccales archaeon]